MKIIYLLLISLCACSTPQKNQNDGVDLKKAAQLNVSLGLSYLKQGEMSRAKAKLNRAMNLAPELSEVHYGLAFYLEEVGEIAAAKKAYQQSLALNPRGGIEHNNYGAFLGRQKEYKAAEKHFLQALEDPNYLTTAEALENAGLCVLQIPDQKKAQTYFERALRQDPKRSQALIELGWIAYKQKAYENAQYYHDQYMKIADPSPRSQALAKRLAGF